MRKTATIAIIFALFVSVGATATVNASSLPKALAGNTNSKLGAKSASAVKRSADSSSKAPAAPPQPTDPIVTVQSGDTLIGLSETHGSTYQRVFDANDSITDPNIINPGQQFRIPADDAQLPDRISTLPQATQQSVATAASAYDSSRSSTAYPAVSGNDAKAFIYSHESGNNPNSTSPNGCYGLGQDCNGRVRAQCGADYACQDAYFTNYANSRYSGWDGAVAFWQTHGWW